MVSLYERPMYTHFYVITGDRYPKPSMHMHTWIYQLIVTRHRMLSKAMSLKICSAHSKCLKSVLKRLFLNKIREKIPELFSICKLVITICHTVYFTVKFSYFPFKMSYFSFKLKCIFHPPLT